MKNLILFISLFSFVSLSQAKTTIRIKALGSSPKGQYIAFEEFGYINNTQIAFSKIKVMNVWNQEYVGDSISIKSDTSKDLNLVQVRAKAKQMALKNLKKFNIKDS